MSKKLDFCLIWFFLFLVDILNVFFQGPNIKIISCQVILKVFHILLTIFYLYTAANDCHRANQYLRSKNWIENKSCSGPQVFSQLILTTGSWDSPPVYLVTIGPNWRFFNCSFKFWLGLNHRTLFHPYKRKNSFWKLILVTSIKATWVRFLVVPKKMTTTVF